MHLVRASEQASSEDSRAYRRQVVLFAALGYAWVLLCLALSIALLAWVAHEFGARRFRGYHVWLVLSGLGLLWVSLRALWIRFPPPEGIELKPADAPALFEALSRIRAKVHGPPIHRVLLTGDFNASIGQRPRFGLAGGQVNHLSIGLPLLMALDRRRVLAVLAHEYGHLRRDHGRFSAWIYRTRASWTRLYESMDADHLAGWLTQGFLKWYFPRFIAKTFALARSDEYEADRIAARLVGRDVAAATLAEIAVKARWLDSFWRSHWGSAGRHPLPVGPYAAMRVWLASAPPAAQAQQILRTQLRELSGVDDTHPVLRDRLEALDVRPALPAWSQRAALDLLEPGADRWIARLDKAWAGEHAQAWKRHHVRMRRLVQRLEALAAATQAKELAERGDLQARLGMQEEARASYLQALAADPDLPAALKGAWQTGAAQPAPERRALAERLYAQGPEHHWWAARALVDLIEADPAHLAAELQAWRARLKDAEAAEDRAWEELMSGRPLAGTSAHDLQSLEMEELLDELADFGGVRRAWLLSKSIREFPRRRCYLLAVDAGDVPVEEAPDLCAALRREVTLPGPVRVVPVDADTPARDLDRMPGAALALRRPAR